MGLPVSAQRENLRVITDGNWEEILTGEWMIEFFAPWCPACQQLQPVWNEIAELAEDLGINIAKVDVTEQPGLSGRFIITALPTIYHCKNGVFRRYQGTRTKDDILSFIEEKKWQSIEPVSSWFGPSSFLMNMMSALFKLSMFIRVLVFIADFVFPSRRFSSPAYYQKKHVEQARLLHQFEEEQEADGEEEEEDEDGKNEEWQREGAAENTVRKRTVVAGEEKDT
ncbi:thioredoxin-related transmembrane protein 1 isoform X3 [Hoplias malabaricus]|uniref:thioredoxin-related transmembrane protein 1 isoform X3 n=1 Tax=Hoplias malabaricus TaxID=27720 RepID=UPI003461FE22